MTKYAVYLKLEKGECTEHEREMDSLKFIIKKMPQNFEFELLVSIKIRYIFSKFLIKRFHHSVKIQNIYKFNYLPINWKSY